MRVIVSILAALLTLVSSCERLGLCKDDVLVTEQTVEDGLLRLDGYYFLEIEDAHDSLFTHLFYIYKNGVIRLGTSQYDDARSGAIEVNFENSDAIWSKGGWGVCRIVGRDIELEYWQPATNGCEKTVYERGSVLNDSIFVLTLKEFRKNQKVKKTENQTREFRFRHLDIKPDSTNDFIE